jgi:glycosyltransferase involved in cell wall biosynthesis
MKIAIVGPSHRSFISKFLPNYNQEELPEGYFGAQFIGTIIEELLERNHEVIALTTSIVTNKDYTVREFSYNKFKWIVIPSRKHAFRFNERKLGRIVDFFALECLLLKKAIIDNNPQIVHAFWSYEFAKAGLKSELPLLVTVEDNAYIILKFYRNLYRFLRFLMAEIVLRKIKFASTVSPYMLEYVTNRCEKVKVIPNPTKILSEKGDIVKDIQRKIDSLSSPNIIMIFNGWNNRKNGMNGLLAFQLLQLSIPTATLSLYGHDTEIGGLASKDAEALHLQNVFFHGPVSHDVLIEGIKNAHILLHPALEESFGVVLIEAMSLGVVPIGGQKSGAVPWVINNTNLLVNVLEPAEISNKLLTIISNKNLYYDLASTSYTNTINRFSAQSVVDNYLQYYNEIIPNQ